MLKKLNATQYYVTQQNGTEAPFSGRYYDHYEKGTYHCICCGQALFASDTKFESGTGWPSFYDAIETKRINNVVDDSLGVRRTEARCGDCDAHLGHVFPDGPKPTNLRYCINSAALKFQAKS